MSLIIIGEVKISWGGSIYRNDIFTPGSKYRGGQNIVSHRQYLARLLTNVVSNYFHHKTNSCVILKEITFSDIIKASCHSSFQIYIHTESRRITHITLKVHILITIAPSMFFVVAIRILITSIAIFKSRMLGLILFLSNYTMNKCNNICKSVCLCVCVCLSVCLSVCLYVCMYVCMHVCTCTCTRMYVWYVYMSIPEHSN